MASRTSWCLAVLLGASGAACARKSATPASAIGGGADAAAIARDAGPHGDAIAPPRSGGPPPRSGGPSRRAVVDLVVAPSLEPLEVSVFQAGTRALVSQGGRFVGYAEPGKAFVADATLSSGIPESADNAPDHPLALTGRFPDITMIYGHFIGGGDRPAGHAAYAWRGRSWSRIDRRAWDGPWSLAEDRGAAVLFEPRPFHLENGMLPAPPPNEPADRCAPRGKVALGEIVTSPANRRAPQVDKRFFPMKIATDGASRMMTWGYFGCEPGAFAGRVDGGAVTLERLPGTEACTVRDPTNGLPLVTASLFPAADGGAYALVASGLRYDEQSVPYTSRVGEPSVPCIPAPLRLRRGKTGGWIKVGASLPPGTLSGMRVVSSSAIDPAGTAFLVASPTTVLRVDASGAIEELGVTRACLALPSSGEAGEEPRDDQAAEIERVIATAPDDVWIVVSHRDHGQGVCRARFGTTKP